MQAMGLFDFLDGIPDDYEPKQRMTAEETEETFEYLKNHPLFMKEIPKDIENHPDLLALQSLQYDDTPENNAKSLLKKGNELMQKHGEQHYFMMKAFEIYCDGLEEDSKDNETMAKLFSNRALIQYKRKNYKAAIQDCKYAIEKDPQFIKPYYRCAQCLFQVMRFKESLKFCELALQIKKEQDIENLKKMNLEQLKKIQDKELNELNLQKLYQICASKGIRLAPCQVSLHPDYQPQRLSLEQENPPILTVPILISYPEFKQRDFIQFASEKSKLQDNLIQIFSSPLPWDTQQIYNMNTIECFIELDDQTYAKVNPKSTILSIMQGYQVTIKDFIELILVCKETDYYKTQFRSEYRWCNI